MRLTAAITGDLNKVMAQEQSAAEKAVSQGVHQATDGLKTDLRGQITKAGLGSRLSQSWQSQIYPKSGMSINAAGFVYSKAPEIVSAFEDSVTIRSKHGRFLAIPTENVIRRDNRKLSPADFEEAGIPLRYIPPQGSRRVGLLVADNFRVTKKGKAKAASSRAIKTGRGLATVVMFILISETHLKKRLDIDSAAQKWLDALPDMVIAAWETENGQ